MNNNHFYCLFIFIFLFSNACKKDEKNTFSEKRGQQIVNTYDNGILPLFTAFEAASNELNNAVTNFNTNLDATSLQRLKQKWIEVSLLWEKTEVYKLSDYNDSFLYYRIHRWPVDTSRIEEKITTASQIDQIYIESQGSSLIGLSAMEYLLFENDENTTLAKFQDTKRQEYLAAISLNIYTNASASKTIWINNENTFKNSLESEISGSQNQLANALISQVDEIIKARLESAMGDGSSIPASKELLEAHRSEISLDLIKSVFEEIEKCYTGNYSATTGVGFDDCVLKMNKEDLNNNILNAIAEINNQLNAMSGSTLSYYIENDLQTVENLKLALRELLILLKADMTSVLSITVTISDNDGD